MLVCALLVSLFSFSQVEYGGEPLSWQINKIDWHPTLEVMPEFDVAQRMAEDDVNNQYKDQPYRFGENFYRGDNLNNSGIWYDMPNGDRIWMIKYKSEGAHSINLGFDMFFMPEGAKMFVYTPDHEVLFGAFDSRSNTADETFSTWPLPGEELIIEYFEPAAVAGQGLLQVERVTHAYRDIELIARDIGDSGSCNNNVICPEGAPWTNEINSVAIIVVGGSGICTGALVNNTANDGHPYFMTANHCVGNVATWSFRFNFQSTTCGTNNVGAYQTVSGGTLLASNAGSDFALLEINGGTPIPPTYNPYYAGWDATGTTPSSSTAIHHPSGDLKKISFDNQAAGQANWGGAATWQIFTWEDGTTEPGSSGSPLFDQNHRFIGQLYGGQASCSNNVNDYYGRFDVTYPSVCNWLAPGCNTMIIDGYDPNAPTVNLDAQLLSITDPDGVYCATSVTPQVTIRNAGTTTLTSVDIDYDIDGGTNQTFNWTGSLATGATEVVNLASQSPGSGAHTFNVSLDNPNGGTDENTANDGDNSSFTISTGATQTLDLTLDCWGSETTWEIRDAGDNILYSGGPYSDNTPGGAGNVSVDFCLSDGCYDFWIYDAYGDGIDGGTEWPGSCNQDGDFTITDDQGGVLVQMTDPNFDSSGQSHNFCITTGVAGCTTNGACNFDPAATVDDGSCTFPGCTTAGACNYDAGAGCDNGSCTFPGCNNPAACNYDAGAGCDDGSCDLGGCTNPAACNFDAGAACDDGSCALPDGCTSPGSCNYDPSALCDDGSCIPTQTYYYDSDGDGYGDLAVSVVLCSPLPDFVLDNTDCDDSRDDVYPGAAGTGEGIDNDCNGLVEGDEQIVCLADMNFDGLRNAQDLLLFLSAFGCDTAPCPGDFNNDGITNAGDLLVLLSVFGTFCP